MERTIKVGATIFCLIDGDVKKRVISRFSTDGENLVVITDRGESLVYMCDAFPSREEANSEMKIRLSDT